MNKKQKTFRTKRNRSVALTLLVFVILGTFVALWLNRADSEAVVDPIAKTSIDSDFSFTGTSDWRQGPMNQTSIALFSNDTTSSCFVSAEFKQGPADISGRLSAIKTQLAALGGKYTTAELETKTLTMHTPSGQKQYDLHQLAVTTLPGAEKVMGGQQYGDIQLESGHIEVMGQCNDPENLLGNIPALQAIKFDTSEQ